MEKKHSHRIHGTGISTYIYQKKSTIHVGKYTSPMDPMYFAKFQNVFLLLDLHWFSGEANPGKLLENPGKLLLFGNEKNPTSWIPARKNYISLRAGSSKRFLWNDMVPEVGNFQVLWHPKWWVGITISTLGCISIISLQISQEEMENWMGEVYQPAPPKSYVLDEEISCHRKWKWNCVF